MILRLLVDTTNVIDNVAEEKFAQGFVGAAKELEKERKKRHPGDHISVLQKNKTLSDRATQERIEGLVVELQQLEQMLGEILGCLFERGCNVTQEHDQFRKF